MMLHHTVFSRLGVTNFIVHTTLKKVTCCFPDGVFIYLAFYVAFYTVQVISRWVVGRAEETSTYSSLGFCTVNCRPSASNYQLSHLRPCRGSNPGFRGGRQECYHSATVAPPDGVMLILRKIFMKCFVFDISMYTLKVKLTFHFK